MVLRDKVLDEAREDAIRKAHIPKIIIDKYNVVLKNGKMILTDKKGVDKKCQVIRKN